MESTEVREKRVPHVTIILPPSSTEDDAVEAATDLISDGLNVKRFDILHVEMVEEGEFKTAAGVLPGKRYIVAYLEKLGEVIYLHPDYEKHVGRE